MSEFFSLTTSNTHINFNLFVTIRRSDNYLDITKSVYLLGVLICLPVLDVLGRLFSCLCVDALTGVSLDPATGDVGIGTIASIRGGVTLIGGGISLMELAEVVVLRPLACSQRMSMDFHL